MVTFEQLRKYVASGPNVLSALAPRTYKGADGWCSPQVPAVFFGGECASAISSAGDVVDTTKLLVTMAGKLAACRVPTFHVGADLLDAVTRTMPPPGLQWEGLNLPHPAGVFLLPKGAIRTSDGRSWDWVAWALTKYGEPVKVPGLWTQTIQIGTDDGGDPFSIATASTTAGGHHDGMLVWNASMRQAGELAADWDTVKDFPGSIAPDYHESDVLKRFRIIVANLFLVMESRPELVEHDGQKVRAMKKGPAREEWTPNWIGRTYRVQRPDGDGTHASPRLHWRRGHYRRQACGTGRKEHKIIWLEPCLVGATADDA